MAPVEALGMSNDVLEALVDEGGERGRFADLLMVNVETQRDVAEELGKKGVDGAVLTLHCATRREEELRQTKARNQKKSMGGRRPWER